jgi:hypothetical protein
MLSAPRHGCAPLSPRPPRAMGFRSTGLSLALGNGNGRGDKGRGDVPTACVARTGSGPYHRARWAAYAPCRWVSCASPGETRAVPRSRGPPGADIPCHGGACGTRGVHAASAAADGEVLLRAQLPFARLDRLEVLWTHHDSVCDRGSLPSGGTRAVPCTVDSVKAVGSFLGTTRFVSRT